MTLWLLRLQVVAYIAETEKQLTSSTATGATTSTQMSENRSDPLTFLMGLLAPNWRDAIVHTCADLEGRPRTTGATDPRTSLGWQPNSIVPYNASDV